jgi:hypothetical protein
VGLNDPGLRLVATKHRGLLNLGQSSVYDRYAFESRQLSIKSDTSRLFDCVSEAHELRITSRILSVEHIFVTFNRCQVLHVSAHPISKLGCQLQRVLFAARSIDAQR